MRGHLFHPWDMQMRNWTPWLMMLLLVGCEASEGEVAPSAEVPTFAEVSGLLIERGCAESNCHQGAEPQANLNLEPQFAYEALVNQPCSMPGAAELGLNLVTPGDADSSFLYVKITLPEDDAILGLPMPMTGKGLSIEDTELIRRWIEAGALRD